MASRNQRIRKILCQKAKQGYFSTKLKIYPSEIKNLRRQGFIVEKLKPNLYGEVILVKISWECHSFENEDLLTYAETLYNIALKKRN